MEPPGRDQEGRSRTGIAAKAVVAGHLGIVIHNDDARGVESAPRGVTDSRLPEDSNQFRSVPDQVLATRAPYGLYFILLNVDGHRFSAAFWTGQNVIGRICVTCIHRRRFAQSYNALTRSSHARCSDSHSP